jgi:flagellar biosynthesis protein FliR
VLVQALVRSFALVPAGGVLAGDGLLAVARLVGVALATGLAVAAPVIALSWATDAAVGIVLRAAPGLPATELAVPVRILAGGTVLWLSLGVVADRLLAGAVHSAWLREVLGP